MYIDIYTINIFHRKRIAINENRPNIKIYWVILIPAHINTQFMPLHINISIVVTGNANSRYIP